MSWAVGYDSRRNRDIGYGVPATCDYPGCGEKIDRGLSYICASQHPYGGEHGCGLFFCNKHHRGGRGECERCQRGETPFTPTPDLPTWIAHKLADPSWERWREEHTEEVKALHLKAKKEDV
jgi:hypothetical protein